MTPHLNKLTLSALALCVASFSLNAQTPASSAPPASTPAATVNSTPTGEVKDGATVHTQASAAAVVAGASIALPASVTSNGKPFMGLFKDAPATKGKAPVVVFLHGSSGLGLKAIGEWQTWLATQGVASIAPDSFALPNRLTYKSPVGKDVYEKIHALRASEIDLALKAVQTAPWADSQQVILAGTSEGAVAVARHSGEGFTGKMLYAWSCEDNYFVQNHQTHVSKTQPVLNVISQTDPFFSPANSWLGNNQNPKGHCADVFKDNPKASVALIPGAPHTLLNLPAARHVTRGFLAEIIGH